ncbi:hypothetical protein [Arthrobacter sp. CG_A4]|uniref:hypothetical protein n=1 Tax=Arthrobacter sp. CG_A4 TaxID=3071706 RepID=UPI002E0EBF15
MGELELADIAARLYALPFDEFVAARTSAAQNAAGTNTAGTNTAGTKERRSLAAQVRSLPKPSVAAWTVNILAAQQPDTLLELAALGQSMRAAQSALDAAELRRLGRERRQLLSGAVQAARLLAEQLGRKISGTIAAEVEETLRAAASDEGASVAVRSGRLLRGLTADGVDAVDLAGAVALPSLSEPAATAAPAPTDTAPAPSEIPTSTPCSTPGSTSAGSRSAAAGTARPKQPRLRAVRQEARTPAPSALERAAAALQEAEQTAREAAEQAGHHEVEQIESARLAAQLAGTVHSLREQLTQTELDLKAARKRQELSAARAQQATRAADKALHQEDLARERVLRLGNTPD